MGINNDSQPEEAAQQAKAPAPQAKAPAPQAKAPAPQAKAPAPQASSARIFWRTVSAVTAIGCVASLAVFGGNLFDGSTQAAATGTELTVAAPAVALVCPQNFGTGQDSAGSVNVDGLSGNAGTSWMRTSTALLGGAGSASFDNLLSARDVSAAAQGAQTEDSTVPLGMGPLIGPADSLSPSEDRTQNQANSENTARVTRTDLIPGALTVTTKERAVSNAEAGEYTAVGMAAANTAGDARGLAASSCGAAGSEHWLVGGSTAVGSSSKLVIQNPSVTPATVKITLWGPSGRVELAGSDTFLVSGGTQISTLLEGIAAEQRRIAVHVEASGAQITAYIAASELDGVTAKGIDYVTESAAPSRAQVIPAVKVAEADVDSEDASTVRLLVPNFADAMDLAEQTEEDAADVTDEPVGTARLYLLGADGNVVLFGAQEIELVAGAVQDISLGGAPAGTYSVLVEADVPVVAGARGNSTGEASEDESLRGVPSDFAWSGAAAVYRNEEFVTRQAFERFDVATDQIPDDMVTLARSGAVALPSGMKSAVTLVGLPAVGSVEELSAALAEVPPVYGGSSESEQEEPASDEQSAPDTEADAKREAWTPTLSATLVAYRADGSVAVERQLAFAVGQSKTVALDNFGDIASVAVLPGQGSRPAGEAETSTVSWSVHVTAPDISGSIAQIAPAWAAQDPTDMIVTRTQQLVH